jgi:hypothetical protein
VVRIQGESDAVTIRLNGYEVLTYEPYSSAQNLCGNYPIMVQCFLCEVEGRALIRSEESRNIRWMRLAEVKALLEACPERFYPMHLTTLRRYVASI